MNISTGIDIIEIDTIRQLILRYGDRFLKRALTDQELHYCRGKPNVYQHYAARLAVKEAAMKALGCGWNKGVQWKHIEVVNNAEGAPHIELKGNALALFSSLCYTETSVSISHCKRYVTAIVIMYRYGLPPGPPPKALAGALGGSGSLPFQPLTS